MFYTVTSINGNNVMCSGMLGVFVVKLEDIEGEVKPNCVIAETGDGKYKVCGENMDNLFQIPSDMI